MVRLRRARGCFIDDIMLIQTAGLAVASVCAFAALKGGWPECLATCAYGLGWLAALLVHEGSGVTGAQWRLVAIDLAILGLLGALAWKSPRLWPIWASAFQLLAIMSHVLAILDAELPMRSVIIVINLAGLGVLTALVVGVFQAWGDRRAEGREQDQPSGMG